MTANQKTELPIGLMDIGHSAAVQTDYSEGGEMTQSVRTPISNPAGAPGDNRNLCWGRRVAKCVCVCVRVGAFFKNRG